MASNQLNDNQNNVYEPLESQIHVKRHHGSSVHQENIQHFAYFLVKSRFKNNSIKTQSTKKIEMRANYYYFHFDAIKEHLL